MVSGKEVGIDSNKMLVRELIHDDAASTAVAISYKTTFGTALGGWLILFYSDDNKDSYLLRDHKEEPSTLC